jgi:hypothetical protein
MLKNSEYLSPLYLSKGENDWEYYEASGSDESYYDENGDR